MLLAGDIGGTKTILAAFSPETGPRRPVAQAIYPSANYSGLEVMAREFLAEVNLAVDHACFDVAGPVVEGRARTTNLPWVIDETALQQALNLRAVRLVNDLEAIAHAVPILQPEDLHTLNEGEVVPEGAMAVVAPGTGLGEAYLTWDGSGYRAHASEGGHADFAPTNPTQIELLRYLRERFDGHVSFERVCSGLGIPHLYDFFRDSGYAPELPDLAEQLAVAADRTPLIMNAALARPAPCTLCTATLDTFVEILGAEAGNMALKVLATGGVYLGGGIPPRILAVLDNGRFIAAFRRKGRFADLLGRVPVHVITTRAALIGAARYGLAMAPA